MNRWQEMVREFHLKFGQEVGADPCIRTADLRARLILEEAFETAEGLLGAFDACEVIDEVYDEWAQKEPSHKDDLGQPCQSLPGVADGLADLIYVALGTAVACGVDLAPIFDAVHAANMAKKGGGFRGDGKLLKPPGWQPPDIASLLRAQGWDGALKP